jgi:hypothetical protein
MKWNKAEYERSWKSLQVYNIIINICSIYGYIYIYIYSSLLQTLILSDSGVTHSSPSQSFKLQNPSSRATPYRFTPTTTTPSSSTSTRAVITPYHFNSPNRLGTTASIFSPSKNLSGYGGGGGSVTTTPSLNQKLLEQQPLVLSPQAKLAELLRTTPTKFFFLSFFFFFCKNILMLLLSISSRLNVRPKSLVTIVPEPIIEEAKKEEDEKEEEKERKEKEIESDELLKSLINKNNEGGGRDDGDLNLTSSIDLLQKQFELLKKKM